jgi:hypothetical protein
LADALLFDEKISQSAAVFWFGLRDVGILQIFYSTPEPSSKEQLLTLRIFGARLGGKDCGLCPYNPSAAGGLEGFWYEYGSEL